jgi:hypothetical protein
MLRRPFIHTKRSVNVSGDGEFDPGASKSLIDGTAVGRRVH